MCKCISFGNYNKLYKYIFYYLFFKLFYEYFFSPNNLPDKITIDYLKNDIFRNNNPLVQETFNYFGIFIISLIFFLSKNKAKTLTKLNNINESNNSSVITLIYNENIPIKISISVKSLCLILSLYIICVQLKDMYELLDLKELTYWMFEILSICLITSAIFKKEIYNFKKLSIGIIIFSAVFKFFSTYHSIKDNEKYIYKDYIWFIPIGIISIILILLGRDYALCQIKYFFDIKYISELKLLVWLGMLGTIICLTGGLISTFISCINRDNIKYICKINYNNKLYYDNFKAYFKNIWKEEKVIINIFRILIVLSQIFINYMLNLYLFLIIKKLSPEYYICSYHIFYLIIEFVDFIYDYSHKKIYNLLAQFIAIFGTFIYLELIELKFCKLDYYLKKNIGKRGDKDSSIEELYIEDNDSGIYYN